MNAAPKHEETLHVLLTRFNVRSGGKEQTLRQHPDWLRERFDLFERFCLPSVRSQTQREFRWLVFFDVDTPEHFKVRIEGYRSVPQFEPVLVGDWSSGVVRRAIEDHVHGKYRYLLTTRLDNDDALNSRFVSYLREHLTEVVPRFYNFPHGLIYSRGRVFAHSDFSSAFVSYAEPIDTFQTVWKIPHHLIRDANPIVQLDLPNAWLQVIHGRNVSNRVKGRRISEAALAKEYPHLVDVPLIADTIWNRLMERIVFWPMRSLRELAIRMLKVLVKARAGTR